MTAKRFLCFFWLLVCVVTNASDRPNVLFIVVDDLRPEFGAYGCDCIHSPNLDRLAQPGL